MVQGVYVLYGSELVFKEIVPLSTYSTFVLCDPNPEEMPPLTEKPLSCTTRL